MVSLFLLALSFTTILSMDHEQVQESSDDAYGMPHIDVQAGAVDTGTSHDDAIHEDESVKLATKMLNERFQKMSRNDREKIKKKMGKMIYKIILRRFQKERYLELKHLQNTIKIDVDWNKLLFRIKVPRRSQVTGYKKKREEIDHEHRVKLLEQMADFNRSQTKLNQKYVQTVDTFIEYAKNELCSHLGKKPEILFCVNSLDKKVKVEMEEEISDLQRIINGVQEGERIDKIWKDLRDYVESTNIPDIVVSQIANIRYEPFINYAKEVNYHGKKSDKILKIHCSNLIDDDETAETCRKLRARLMAMPLNDIIEIYHLHKKNKHQK